MTDITAVLAGNYSKVVVNIMALVLVAALLTGVEVTQVLNMIKKQTGAGVNQ